MILHDLQENKFAKLRRAMSDVFGVDFNFEAPTEKLIKVQEATSDRIDQLKAKGVDATSKDYQKLLLIAEGLKVFIREVAPARQDAKKVKVKESADLDQAEVLLAAKQMADDLQKMAENLASMQVEELMSIVNAMKEEVGTAEAEAFEAAVEAAISGALEAVKGANEQVNNAVLTAQGQGPAPTDMDMDMGPEEPMGDMDGDAADMDVDSPADEFGGADAADDSVDGEREMKEEVEDAYLKALKMVKEAQKDGMVSKDVLKQAYSLMRK
jgi:hypothetical protein